MFAAPLRGSLRVRSAGQSGHVGPVRGKRIVNVGDLQNSRRQPELVALPSVGIARQRILEIVGSQIDVDHVARPEAHKHSLTSERRAANPYYPDIYTEVTCIWPAFRPTLLFAPPLVTAFYNKIS